MLKDQIANKFGVKLDDDRGSGGLLGGEGERIHQGGVDVRGVGGGDISTLLGSIQDGQDNFLENDGKDLGGSGGRGDGEAVDPDGVGAERLVELVNFLR